MKLRPFHRRFLRQVLRPEIDSCVLSLPRGNEKSTFADHIAARILHPDDVLFRKATESVVLPSSLEQARIIYRACRVFLGDHPDFRWSDSLTRVQVVHKPTTLRVISSNTRAGFGLAGTPYVLADEPGAWQVVGGELLHDAIQTSIGKSGSFLRVMYFERSRRPPPDGGPIWSRMILMARSSCRPSRAMSRRGTRVAYHM